MRASLAASSSGSGGRPHLRTRKSLLIAFVRKTKGLLSLFAVLRIRIRIRTRIRMFLGLLDPDPLVRGMDPEGLLVRFCPGSQVKKTQTRANCSATPTQQALCLRLASMYKAESCYVLQPSMTQPPNSGYVRNTSVAVCNLYCVHVIIVRLN